MVRSIIRQIGNWFAVAWTVAVGAFLLYGPIHAVQTSSVVTTPGGAVDRTVGLGFAGLASTEGLGAYLLVAVTIGVVLAPLVSRTPQVRRGLTGAGATILSLLVVLGAMSIGLVYVPAAVALILATILDRVPGREATFPNGGPAV